jgi:hypothetical protein
MRLLKRAFIYAVCTAYNCLTYPKDIWHVYFRRQHNKITSQKIGLANPLPRPNGVAVVVVFPSDESVVFTKNLLMGLLASECYVLVTSNRALTPRQQEVILPHCHMLIERPNTGRDIGAYQHGMKWLKQQNLLQSASLLILANDSLFYPKNIEKVIADMVQNPAPWQCLFENFEKHYHAQSFFLLFRKEIFLSQVFIQFWKKYFPRSNRVHSIDRGEVALTKVLKETGHLPVAYYATSQVIDTLKQRIKNETLENMPLSEMLFELYCPIALGGLLNNQTFSIYQKKVVRLLEKLLSQTNPAGRSGLAVSYLLHAPLKRDLMHHRIFDLSQIVRYAGGLIAEERMALERDLKKKGFPDATTNILKKTLLAGGCL